MEDKGSFIWTLISLAIIIYGIITITDPNAPLGDNGTGAIIIFGGIFLLFNTKGRK